MARAPLTLALVGAESTGKTTLAADMAARLGARGLQVRVVPEALRAWCERQGRLPRPEEAMDIAQAQEQQVDEAAARGADIVIADGTALMVAIWVGLLFEDHPLWRFALVRQGRYALTLLTGLDLPWVADGLQRRSPDDRAHTDALVRDGLRQAGVDFRVVYGRGPERSTQALEALAAFAPWAWTAQPERPPRWAGLCERCADPDCEHRLFRGLMGQ